MKSISWYWNLLHYFIYVWYKAAYRFSNYLSPIRYLLKVPFIKRFYAKHGVSDMNKFADDVVFNNTETGINSIWAGIQMGGLFVLLEYGLFNFIQGIIGKSLIQYVWESKIYAIVFMLVLLGFAGLFNYFVLFKEDKYLNYFDEFEKMPKSKKVKYGWSCFITVVLILLFVIISFVFVPYQHH